MNLNYELCKKLKDVGFPQDKTEKSYCTQPDSKTPFLMSVQNPQGRLNLLAAGYEIIACPNLSELIKACGKNFGSLEMDDAPESWLWTAQAQPKLVSEYPYISNDKTPEEAVMKLCLEMLKDKRI